MLSKKIVIRIKNIFIYGIVSTILSFLISLILSKIYNVNIENTMTVIGLIIICIAILSSIGGNPSGIAINSIGQLNSQYISTLNIEVTKNEREATNYFKNAKNHTKLYFTESKLNVILNGLIVIAISMIISLW